MKDFLAGPVALPLRCKRVVPAGVSRALVVALLLLAAAAPVAAQSPVPSGVNQLAETLAREGTYVSPQLAAEVPVAAEARLQRQLDAASLRGVTLRLAVLDQVPLPYRALEDFTAALFAALQLPDGILVVATPHGIAARTDRVSDAEVAQEIAAARSVLERDGYVRALEAVADGLVADALALGTPAAAAPATAPAQSADRVFERRGGNAGGLPVMLLIVLVLVVGGCLWLARRLWQQQLGRVLAARQLAQDRLAAVDGEAHRRAIEVARRSVADGTQALQAMQSLPWWQTWLVPWAPPPQLRLADYAFLAAAQALSDVAAAGADLPAHASTAVHRPSPAAMTDRGPTARSASPTAPAVGLPDPAPTAAPPSAGAQPDNGGAGVGLGPAAGTTPGGAASAAEAASRPRVRRRWGWLARRSDPLPTGASGSLAPEHVLAGLQPEAPLACFFCGSPLKPALAQVGTVALAGRPLRPLLCPRHAAALAADERPAVRARSVEGDTLVPWFQDASYSPDWDFDPSVSEPTLGWDVLPPPDQLLAGRLRAVVHADDARWRAPEPPPASVS